MAKSQLGERGAGRFRTPSEGRHDHATPHFHDLVSEEALLLYLLSQPHPHGSCHKSWISEDDSDGDSVSDPGSDGSDMERSPGGSSWGATALLGGFLSDLQGTVRAASPNSLLI